MIVGKDQVEEERMDTKIIPEKFASARSYFENTEPPANFEQDVQCLHSFVDQLDTSQPVICVTAGGTKVALERNTVRFLDNFSR